MRCAAAGYAGGVVAEVVFVAAAGPDNLDHLRKARRAQNRIRRRAPALRAERPHLDQDVERLNLPVILYGVEEDIGRERVVREDRFKMRARSPMAVDFPCATRGP